MKKYIFVIMVLVLNISFVSFSQDREFVEHNERSSRLSDEDNECMRKELGLNSEEEIFKIYNSPVIWAFGNNNDTVDDVEDVLNSNNILGTVYAVYNREKTKDNWRIFSNQRGKTTYAESDKIDNNSFFYRALEVLRNDEIINDICDFGKIYNKYFFYNHTMCQGTAIYYETEKGDFVYYEGYFFPKDDFISIMRELRSQMGSDTPPGGFDITSVCDLTKYDINSPKFDSAAFINKVKDNNSLISEKNNNNTQINKNYYRKIFLIILSVSALSFIILCLRKKQIIISR